MWDDPNAAAARQAEREAARRRRRAGQRADLLASARVLIPDHGIAVPLASIAVHAGLSRHAAQALFNTTAELATALVRHAWHALAETVAAARPATQVDLAEALITAIRADAPAHQVYHALRCGVPGWQRSALAEADILLARALGDLVGAVYPGLAPSAALDLARRLIVLARDVAPAAPVRAEAELIAGMLDGAVPRARLAAVAAQTAQAQPVVACDPPPAEAPPPSSHVRASILREEASALPADMHPPSRRPRMHDPPAQAA